MSSPRGFKSLTSLFSLHGSILVNLLCSSAHSPSLAVLHLSLCARSSCSASPSSEPDSTSVRISSGSSRRHLWLLTFFPGVQSHHPWCKPHLSFYSHLSLNPASPSHSRVCSRSSRANPITFSFCSINILNRSTGLLVIFCMWIKRIQTWKSRVQSSQFRVRKGWVPDVSANCQNVLVCQQRCFTSSLLTTRFPIRSKLYHAYFPPFKYRNNMIWSPKLWG